MNNNFKYHTGIIGYPILFVILIWLIFWIEFRFNVDLKSFGIQPRKIEGIYGIMLSPFLHLSLEHLINNSIPLFLLSSAIFFFLQKYQLEDYISWYFFIWSFNLDNWKRLYPYRCQWKEQILISFIFFKGNYFKKLQL